MTRSRHGLECKRGSACGVCSAAGPARDKAQRRADLAQRGARGLIKGTRHDISDKFPCLDPKSLSAGVAGAVSTAAGLAAPCCRRMLAGCLLPCVCLLRPCSRCPCTIQACRPTRHPATAPSREHGESCARLGSASSDAASGMEHQAARRSCSQLKTGEECGREPCSTSLTNGHGAVYRPNL
jgi:hypothetical protein